MPPQRPHINNRGQTIRSHVLLLWRHRLLPPEPGGHRAAYDACDCSAATKVCPVTVGGSCTINSPAAGETKYYADQLGFHCQDGQVVAITSTAAPGTESTDDDRQGCFPFCGDKSDAPPPTPKPTTTLAKGGKADRDEDESDGDAGRVLSVLTAAVAALFTV